MHRIEILRGHLVPQPTPSSLDLSECSSSDPVCIVAYCRTPIGTLQGGLSTLTAPQLGSVAIKEALARSGLTAAEVDEVYFGNVLQANIGQAPARQAALGAGLIVATPCTTVNKVCASGMKAIMEGASTIMMGNAEVVVAGGMESMSNTPYYLPQARKGYRMGNNVVVDGMIKDGLWDPYGDTHMGICAEKCASIYKIDRKAQDAHAIESYKRAAEAHKAGAFKGEIVPVTIPGARGQPPKVLSEDEEYKNVSFDRLPKLSPAFKTDGTGTVTAGNASTINDGAAAFVLMRESKAKAKGLKVLARILSFADAAQEPDMFTTAPALAIPKALKRAGLTTKDIDFWEINEAFSVVAIANAQLLGIDQSKLNIYGGAVALGHPIGCSGARITGTLLTVLRNKNAKFGCASICNGGGGASAIVIERVA
eukprot:Phypoly_transcript_05977.p1 GENE.Phypoly_transcript_05977~~Phypoly_transcript_05977.p1  ORF type:complete len:424 (+),score=82.35 Phypoly_transcript_05977:171-1442(+)